MLAAFLCVLAIVGLIDGMLIIAAFVLFLVNLTTKPRKAGSIAVAVPIYLIGAAIAGLALWGFVTGSDGTAEQAKDLAASMSFVGVLGGLHFVVASLLLWSGLRVKSDEA